MQRPIPHEIRDLRNPDLIQYTSAIRPPIRLSVDLYNVHKQKASGSSEISDVIYIHVEFMYR